MLSLLIGGGGVAGPAQSTAIELVGALALGWMLVIKTLDFTDRRLRAPLIWLVILVVVIALQLIPLPPGMWRSIPGKQLEATTADLIGMGDVWRPLALIPENAIRSAISLVPCVAIFLLLYRSEQRVLTWIGWLFAGAAVVNACVGLVQVYGGDTAWAYPFSTTHMGYAVGLFANRNHFALFLVIGLIWMTTALRGLDERERGLGILLGVSLGYAVILLALVASGSRSGVAVGVVTVSVLPFFLVPDRLRGRFAILWCVGMAGLIGLVVVGAGMWPESSLGRLMGRYSAGDGVEEGRWSYWANSIYVIRQSFPFGSGLGSFVAAYQANEPLSNVTRALTNHAHNDYLEVLLELGLAGALFIAAGFGWLAVRAWRGTAALGYRLSAFHAACLSVLAIAGGSLTDYPSRTYAMASVLAACLAIVANGGTETKS